MAEDPTAVPPPSEIWLEEFRRLNPGTSRRVALNEASLVASKEAGGAPEEHMRRWLLSLRASGGGPLAMTDPGLAYERVAAPAMTGAADLLLRGGGAVPPNPLASGLAGLLTPQTLTGAGLSVAAPGVSRIPGAMNRMATSGALGVAGSAASDRSPVEGAAEGLFSQGVGEVVRGGVHVARSGLQHVQRYGVMLKDKMRDASDTLNGILQVVPEFGSAVKSARKGDTTADILYTISEKAENLARPMFHQADALVTKALGGPKADIPLPSQRLGVAPPPTMMVEDVLQLLKEKRARARKAPDGAEGFAIREDKRLFEQDVYAAMARVSPKLEQMYKEVTDHYAKAVSLGHALRDSGSFEGPIQQGTGATYDGSIFLRHLQKNRDEMGYDRYQPVWDALLRGGRPGASDVIGLAPRIRGYFGQGISGTTPNIQFMRQPRGGWRPETQSMLPPIASSVSASAASGYTVEP